MDSLLLYEISGLGLNSKKDRNPPQLRGSNRKNKGINRLERKHHYQANKRLPRQAQGATYSQVVRPLEDKSVFRDQHEGASPAGTEKRHVRRNIPFKGTTPDTPNSYILKTQCHAEFNKKIKWKKLKKASRRRVKNALLQKNNPLPRIAGQPAY
ncbi:hypothetical protein [Endozoicomonas sp. Mp262]|uniref:hypothetical protein n=1 Tax=Endozoicomonas sp. Mp262 TaxID=2919499 RepID=UPI0021D91B66